MNSSGACAPRSAIKSLPPHGHVVPRVLDGQQVVAAITVEVTSVVAIAVAHLPKAGVAHPLAPPELPSRPRVAVEVTLRIVAATVRLDPAFGVASENCEQPGSPRPELDKPAQVVALVSSLWPQETAQAR